jgi:hypothetical protein
LGEIATTAKRARKRKIERLEENQDKLDDKQTGDNTTSPEKATKPKFKMFTPLKPPSFVKSENKREKRRKKIESAKKRMANMDAANAELDEEDLLVEKLLLRV